MGTRWSVQLYAEGRLDDRAIRHLIGARLQRVIDQMSGWEPDSDLSRFGRSAPGSWSPIPEPFGRVLAEALRIAELSDGAFDPTMGALVDLWGFGPAGPQAQPPDDAAIADALALAGWGRLGLEGGRALQPGGLMLDLSGIAKGFAVDDVADALSEAGVRSFLVEIGGELRGEGAKGDGSPWWVALEQPPGAAFAPLVAALHDLSIATSGDYRRSFEHDGSRYAHTLDPRTGRPAADLATVSVLHRSCMTADALATAIGVLGPDEGMAFAARHEVAAWLVAHGPHGPVERLSPVMERMLG
jgi:FAD:protein FMN transferase